MSGSGITRRALLAGTVAAAVAGCRQQATGRRAVPSGTPTPPGGPAPTSPAAAPAGPPDLGQVLARATLPVLCWHQLRDWRPADSSYSRRLLICPPASFRAQLDALADDGWTTVGPDRYLAHLLTGEELPPKAVLLSFDDSQGSQATEAFPQLVQRGMTATFFAMTVVLDKPGWLATDDLRRLHEAGMTVAAHTYDHHRVDRYAGADWATQLEQPRELLERVLGQPVVHFAYPYGAWNDAAIPHVQAAGYRTAFQLADHPTSPQAPVDTLRRTLVDSTWTGPQLLAQLQAS